MKLYLQRIGLSGLTVAYMLLIWLQTSHFNPESVSSYSTVISEEVILVFGICLELLHFFEFGFLFLLLIIVFLSWGRLTFGKEVIASVISFLYGVVDEIHQFYIPFRSASFDDLLKNGMGILLLCWIVHTHYFKKRNSKFGRLLRKISPFK